VASWRQPSAAGGVIWLNHRNKIIESERHRGGESVAIGEERRWPAWLWPAGGGEMAEMAAGENKQHAAASGEEMAMLL